MVEAPRILLEHHLTKLKLPTFLREYEKLARQCAADGLDHVQFLAQLVEREKIDRESRLVERRIRHARFPLSGAGGRGPHPACQESEFDLRFEALVSESAQSDT